MSVDIGLCGYKRAGKTTVAEILCDSYGYYHGSFASPLRFFVADVLGMTLAQLESEKETPIDWLDGVTPRKMMQTVGTEWGRRMVHPEMWVRSLRQRISPALDRGQNVVVSDVRFRNEAQALRDIGGVIVRVTRPGAVRGDHQSESEVDAIAADFEFTNDVKPYALGHAVELLRQRVERR